MENHVLIKKYANRRLYDTEKSKYVTLAEVRLLIREGRGIHVIDVNTEEDVTAFILTQIVLEEARQKNALLPVPLLHLIIRYGDNVLSEFFEKYLQQILGNYLHQKSAFDEQFRRMLDLGIDLSGMAQKTMTGIAPFAPFMDFFTQEKDKGKKE
ncbi:polyhydroxyalkanoate synthesis repressor PhaR [Desulfobotulus alkaliphilus]|uniref:Polyhydroxyalkanoate synthesis repressor PhaR n=1 Tax=Desulfobotulus alkaliphilus TaxID=622671 RepID=A0A562RYU0_9BACT|nr:polyhydroxyalkanoate synthesis regulator DNA-binding domain-containing protein [Desulfobotulus alkaliphilus]TWI74307.1 polyhydroxyalkanoate synthesis repressor PhaR [Desulfobotulus alkaliphilus]